MAIFTSRGAHVNRAIMAICYTLILLEIRRRTPWCCLKSVIVYPARDIPPFLTYCVNGKPRSSLFIYAIMAMLYTHSIGNPPQNTMVVFKIRESVPSARYSPICNVLRQWKTSLIPIYRVYRLYDILIIIITFPYSTCISSFFGSSIPSSLFIFKMFFSFFG